MRYLLNTTKENKIMNFLITYFYVISLIIYKHNFKAFNRNIIFNNYKLFIKNKTVLLFIIHFHISPSPKAFVQYGFFSYTMGEIFVSKEQGGVTHSVNLTLFRSIGENLIFLVGIELLAP